MVVLMTLTRMFDTSHNVVSSVCAGLERTGLTPRSWLNTRVWAFQLPSEPSIASERLWQKTFWKVTPPELRALSPPHPSEDCFRQKTAPGQLWALRGEDWLR